MLDVILFAIFPYVAVILAVVVSVYRYRGDRFSYTSFSTQFLENRQLFWSSVPWHYSIVIVLLTHLLVGVVAGAWLAIVGTPLSLYFFETVGLALGLASVVSVLFFIVRRLVNPRIKVLTRLIDWVVLAVLLLQVALGVYIALVLRWGSVWATSTAVPWLGSLLLLDPRVEYIAALPWLAKLHFLNAFVLLALFPFTRLVHVVTLPITYLWRPHQVAIWHGPAQRR